MNLGWREDNRMEAVLFEYEVNVIKYYLIT